MEYNEIIIRPVQLSDVKKIYEFRKKVVSETHYLITSPDELPNYETLRRYVKIYITDPLRLHLVAEFDRKIVGEITMLIHEKKRMRHVAEFGISVLKDYWGVGIGKNLISNAIKWAITKKVTRIQLEVMKTNKRAIKLYEKFGFQIEGIKRNAVKINNRYIDLLIMGLLIAPERR
ncbi:GNAT family N-acetyltransferase [Thermosipho ferrireducens]|uniref:GNAT family N-acetyltransferase n=1 Tax=Thermosipho ferrireducens TaxID=2571116 RepID=A0ABX7S516_9BACT|nr:GNAT family N-acetyltransferase [Thermosipho ferrireducens]QTA37599.1 GNAT family N-acetyltransferase [Thermosipho ferrireducens]